MSIFLIIISILFWIISFVCLYGRQTIAPAFSYLAMLMLSFAKENGYPIIPLNTTILIGWLAMTMVVMLSAMLQPEEIRRQTRGMTYLIGGALVGMVLGLLGFSIGDDLNLRYGLMIIATALGIALGFLLYTNTPDGRPVKPGSGHFFRYLLAKGFPTAITVMQLGVVLVLLIALKNVNAL